MRRHGSRRCSAGARAVLRDIATDFGISESCLANWLKSADVEDGIKSGATAAENAELRSAKRRIRLLEQEDEVLRELLRRLRSGAETSGARPVRPPPFNGGSS